MVSQTVTSCLSCGSVSLQPVLDLGVQPLANNLLSESDLGKEEPRFPLGIQVCGDCWLVQLTSLVPPVELFSEYLYFSSYSETMLSHAANAVKKFTEELSLGRESFVVEIASNDGYLLRNFVEADIPCLGIEPAANIAEVAEANGVPSLVEFFGPTCAERVKQEHSQADLILGNNVFAHVPDTNGFVSGLAKLLRSEGTICLEFPYGKELFDRNEFDTIYHEHVFYFSLAALLPLFERHGLAIYNVEKLPIHGGSLRIWAGHIGAHEIQSTVSDILSEEAEAGLCALEYYQALGARVSSLKKNLLEKIDSIRSTGKSVAAYGASAKGSTLLNYCDPPKGSIEFIVDRSEAKQGLFSPGLQLPILPPEELEARCPDYTLLLTWNFAEEIFRQQEQYREKGGVFIVPIPEVKEH